MLSSGGGGGALCGSGGDFSRIHSLSVASKVYFNNTFEFVGCLPQGFFQQGVIYCPKEQKEKLASHF